MDEVTLAKRTIDNSARYWAGEYEIACRYFAPSSDVRNEQADLLWVRHQMHKEWHGSGVYGPPGENVVTLVERAAKELREMDELTEHDRVEEAVETLEFAMDELKHFRDFSRVRQMITTEAAQPVEEGGLLSEGAALTELRHTLRSRSRAGRLAVQMSESGGLGFFFGVVSALGNGQPRSEPEKEILRAAQGIIDDERSHLGFNLRRSLLAGMSEKEWDELDESLQAISRQKLQERNQQLCHVLDDATLQAIDRGETEGADFARRYLDFWYEKLEIPLELLP